FNATYPSSLRTPPGSTRFAYTTLFRSGCGIHGGTVHGKTDADGKTVSDGKVEAGDIAATIYHAVGINPKKNYRFGPRPIPLVPEDRKSTRLNSSHVANSYAVLCLQRIP